MNIINFYMNRDPLEINRLIAEMAKVDYMKNFMEFFC